MTGQSNSSSSGATPSVAEVALMMGLSRQAADRIDKGLALPRYRKAIKVAAWIRKRLGMPAEVRP